MTTVPAQVGGWYWVDDRTVHYRPQEYWQAGTKITVDAKVYGVDLGGGMYGETDRTLNLTIGPAKIATIDDATKQMIVTIDGQVVRQYPVSMGRDDSITVDGEVISFVTPSGIYVAQEKYDVKQMNSASYGLPTDYALGYDSAIPLAVRLSNSGIFAHSAPWSVADQGVRNVSHGCINMPPDDAQWFYDTFSYGDIVQVTGTSTQLAPDDGYGDWNIGWDAMGPGQRPELTDGTGRCTTELNPMTAARAVAALTVGKRGSLHFQGADMAIVNFLDAAAGLSRLLITVFRRVAVGTGCGGAAAIGGKRFVLRDGRLLALYKSACLTVGRAWVEALRMDHARSTSSGFA